MAVIVSVVIAILLAILLGISLLLLGSFSLFLIL